MTRYAWLLLAVPLGCGAAPPQSPNGAGTSGVPAERVPVASAAPLRTQRGETPPGAIGGAYPTTVERAAQNGSWVVYCQASQDTDGDGELSVRVGARGELEGDELGLYLALSNLEPLPIDALWAVEPGERRLAVKLAGQAVVIDTKTGSRTALAESDVDLVESGETYPLHRALGFDAPLGTLLFARSLGQSGFEIRALPALGGATSRRFLGQGRLLRLQTSWDGAWSIIESVTVDTNQNSRFDLPLPSGGAKQRCHGPFSTFPAWQLEGDAVTTHVVSTRTSQAFEVKDFVTPLGDGFVFRDEQGGLWLRRGATRQRLAPPECGGQVVHADAERRLVLVACRGPQNEVKPRRSRTRPSPPPRARFPLWLMGERLALELQLELGPTGADHWPERSPRLVPIHAGAVRRLLDMDTRGLLPLGPEDSVLTTFDSRALLVRAGEVELVDAVSGARLLEVPNADPVPSVLVVPGMAWVSPRVIDLGRGAILGETEGDVFALSQAGQVLQTEHVALTGYLPLGPLVWRTPRAL